MPTRQRRTVTIVMFVWTISVTELSPVVDYTLERYYLWTRSYSKRTQSAETPTFGSEFFALRIDKEWMRDYNASCAYLMRLCVDRRTVFVITKTWSSIRVSQVYWNRDSWNKNADVIIHQEGVRDDRFSSHRDWNEDEQTNLVDSILNIILNFGYQAMNAFEKGRNPLVMSKIVLPKRVCVIVYWTLDRLTLDLLRSLLFVSFVGIGVIWHDGPARGRPERPTSRGL